MSDRRILVDTSIWIAYFRNRGNALTDKVDDILANADVYVPKVVLAELVQGARSEKEVAAIEEFTGAFSIIDQSADSWMKAGLLSYAMKRKGHTINLIDCYIAVIADENRCGIFTLDEHFTTIRKYLHIELLR